MLGAQDSLEAQTDTTRHAAGGLIIGMDLARIYVTSLKPVNLNAEISLGYAVTDNLRAETEMGYLDVAFDDPEYSYSLEGYYYRLGADWNVFKREPGELHELFFGAMYGFTSYTHEASAIVIDDGYWGSGEGSLPLSRNMAQWIELRGGMRVELFKNLFLGYTVRFRIFVTDKTDPLLEPYLIPGYGKSGKSSAIGMSYSLFYRIPLKQ